MKSSVNKYVNTKYLYLLVVDKSLKSSSVYDQSDCYGDETNTV